MTRDYKLGKQRRVTFRSAPLGFNSIGIVGAGAPWRRFRLTVKSFNGGSALRCSLLYLSSGTSRFPVRPLNFRAAKIAELLSPSGDMFIGFPQGDAHFCQSTGRVTIYTDSYTADVVGLAPTLSLVFSHSGSVATRSCIAAAPSEKELRQ